MSPAIAHEISEVEQFEAFILSEAGPEVLEKLRQEDVQTTRSYHDILENAVKFLTKYE